MNKRPPKNGETVKKIQNTLLVDGNALFKRAFAGAKDEYNYKGEYVGGLYSFLTTVRKLLTEDLYHRVFVFWDGELSGQLRYNLYKDYTIASKYLDEKYNEIKQLLTNLSLDSLE